MLSNVQLFVTPWTVACQAPIHGIFQARTLEWVAISYSRRSSQPGIKPTSLVSPTLEGGRGYGWGVIVREFGMDMYTLLYLKWLNSKDLLYSTGNSAQCYVAACMRGELGRMDTCTWMAEFLCCLPATITTLLISYISIQNKKGFVKK